MSDDGKVIEVGLPYFLTLPFHYNAAYINANELNREVATIYLMGDDKVVEIITRNFRRRSRLASAIFDTFKTLPDELIDKYILPNEIEYIERMSEKVPVLTCRDFEMYFYSISDLHRVFNKDNIFLWPSLAAFLVKETVEYIAKHDEMVREKYENSEIDFEGMAMHHTFDLFGQYIDPFDIEALGKARFNFGLVNHVHVYQDLVRMASTNYYFERPAFCPGDDVKGNHASVSAANITMAVAMSIAYSKGNGNLNMVRHLLSYMIEQPPELIFAWKPTNALTLRGFTMAARKLITEWYPKALMANAVGVSAEAQPDHRFDWR